MTFLIRRLNTSAVLRASVACAMFLLSFRTLLSLLALTQFFEICLSFHLEKVSLLARLPWVVENGFYLSYFHCPDIHWAEFDRHLGISKVAWSKSPWQRNSQSDQKLRGWDRRKDGRKDKQNGRQARSKSALIISPWDQRTSVGGLGAIIST